MKKKEIEKSLEEIHGKLDALFQMMLQTLPLTIKRTDVQTFEAVKIFIKPYAPKNWLDELNDEIDGAKESAEERKKRVYKPATEYLQ